MSSEFRIKSSVDLSTSEAKQKLNDLKDFEKKPIEIKVKISNTLSQLSKLETALINIGKLSNNKSTNPFKSVTIGAEKTQTEILAMAKVISNTIRGLNKQFTSGKLTVDGVEDVKGQIEDLNKILNNYTSIMTSATSRKFKLFNESNDIKSIKDISSNLSKVESSAEAVSKVINGINFDGLSDSSKIASLSNELKEIANNAKQGFILDVDIGTTLNRIQDIKEEIKQLEQVSDISLKIDSSGLPIEEIERLKASVKELEDYASNLDGSFKSSFNNVSSQLNSSMSAMQKMSKETSVLHKQWGDFTSSFAAYSLGNIAGDFVVDGIRGLKNTFLELDTGMANIKKLANEIDVNTTGKLNNIKNEAISIAKDVGQSSTSVMDAISTTLQMGVGGMEESIEVAKSASILANVGEISADVAAKSMASIINAWKIDPLKEVQVEMNGTVQKSNELTSALDMLNFASNNYSIGVEGLTSAISSGGSTLSAYGVSLGDTIGLMTAANNSLQDPARVGNGLKTISVALQGIKTSASTGELSLNKTAKVLREISGIDVYSNKQKGEIKDMTVILDELYDKWGSFNDEQRAALSEGIAGKQQSAVFQSLMQNYDTFKKIRSEFANNEQFGSAIKENETYVDSLNGKINEFKEIWKDTATSLVTNDFLKSAMDGVNTFSEGISGLLKNIGKLSDVLIPAISGFVSMKTALNITDKSTKIGGFFGGITENIKNISSEMIKAKGITGKLSAGFNALGTVGKASFVGLAVAGIAVAVKALDDYIHRVDIAREKNQERIDELDTEIGSYQSQRNELQAIQKEYDSLANKTNKTKEESARLLELNQELARLMPELVSGYDTEGNPIINMRGDVADLISDLDQAIERKNQLLASEKREQAELAIEKLNEVEVGGLGGGANVYYDTAQEKLNAIQDEYNTKLLNIQKKRTEILDKMGKSDSKEREKHQQRLRKNLQEELDLQNEYVSKYEEKYSEIQTLTNEISEGVFSGVKTSSMFTNDFSDEVKKQLLGLQESLDFSELETSDDINKAKQAILELGTAAATGKVDLTDLKKTVDDTNQQFENGQISYTEYTQKLNELSETIGEITNTDPSFWRNMFEGMSEGSLTASRDLESFLKTFDKTRKDLINGDSVAAGLERQFRAVSSAFDELSNLPADVGIEPIISIANGADIPKEISDLLKGLVSDNDFSMEDQKIALDVMLAYQQGDSSSARKVIEEINKDLKSQGLPEINADVLFEAKVDTTEIENQLKKYKNVNGREEIKTLFTTEVVGLDKLELYEDVIKKLPADEENTNKFLVECSGDLEELNSYEEVSKWLMANPEIMTKYGITLEGSEGIIQVNNELSKLPIEKSVLVKVNKGLAEGNIDAVASAIESLPPEKRLQVIAAIEKAMGNISTVDQRKLKDKLTTLRADATKATKTIDTVEGKKINDKTFTVTAKDKSTGVLSGIKGWLDSIFSKTITVTTNKVTKSTFVGGGGGHAAEGISLSSYSKTLSQTDASNEIALLSENDTTTPLTGLETNGYSSARISTRATQKTPIDNSATKINESIKYNIEMLTELENRIKMVTNSLSALDTKMEQAIGSNKIKYLKEQNQLYEEQKRIQKELEDSLIRQRNYYKYTLENKGFKFNSDGNLINYEEKLASMEKYVASLEKAAKNASDKNKESAQNKYENEKDKLDEVKKYLQAYIDVQMTELPKCKEEWDKLSNSIIENNNEIKKIQNEKWTLNIESQWNVLNQDLEKINNQLEMIDILMKNAFGNDKSNLISEKIELLKMQKSELASNLSYLKDVQFELKNKLSKYGFKFDSSGNISNYVNQLNKLKDTSSEFDDAKKIVDAYLELFLDKIPDVEREIAGLQNTIKDSYNDQLEITKKMEDTITNMYKKQLEDRTKLIESELDAKLKALDKEQKAYNDARSEVDYQNEYSEQLDIVTELQRKLENAARDTSVQGQKKYQELLKELKEEQKNLEQITQNRLDDQVNNSFEDEKERLENESEELIKNLEEKFSDSNIAKMVAEALGSGLFTSIDGQVVKLQSAMEEFLTETGELFGVQGAIIEKEYLGNLQIALNTLKDIKNIYKELEVSKLDKITTDVFNPNTINSRSSNLSINSPLVYVEGNVNSDVVKELEDAAVKIKDDILYELARNTR